MFLLLLVCFQGWVWCHVLSVWSHVLSGRGVCLPRGGCLGGVPEDHNRRPPSTRGHNKKATFNQGCDLLKSDLNWSSGWKWPSVMAFWLKVTFCYGLLVSPYWRAVCILLECILVNYLVFSDLKKSGIWKKKTRISFVLVYLSFLPEAFVLWTVIHHVHTPTKMIIAIVWFIAIKRRVREVGLSLLQFLFITDLWLIWPPQELQYLNFIYRHSTHC